MQPGKLIEEVSTRISELLATSPVRDLEKNVRALLSSSLARFDLVPREEFEVQARVLARTREKLAALEAKIVELEQKLAARE